MSENNTIRVADVKYTSDYTLRLRWGERQDVRR